LSSEANSIQQLNKNHMVIRRGALRSESVGHSLESDQELKEQILVILIPTRRGGMLCKKSPFDLWADGILF
jgi:hypothetical protein